MKETRCLETLYEYNVHKPYREINPPMSVLMKAGEYQPKSLEEVQEGISLLFPLGSRDGFVFLIARTKKENGDSELLSQYLSEETQRLASSFGSEANAQYRFEQFLGALNDGLASQVREGRWKVPITQFDAVVGIACDEQMFFSGTGDLTAIFLHRKPSENYQVFNLFRGIQTEQALPTWEKAFAVVLDGDLKDGDVFTICNQDLQRTIETDELNAVLTTLPPTSSIEKIRQYFPLKTPLLLIVIKMGERRQSATTEMRATPRSQVSVQHFKEKEEETQHLLADQSAGIGFLFETLSNVWKKFKERSRFMRTIAQKNGVARLSWQWVRGIIWKFIQTTQHLKSGNGRAKTVRAVRGTLQSFFGMKKSTKFLLAGIIAVIIVLAISISLFSSARARSQEQRTYEEQVQKIEDTMERGAGAVIYKDENQARSLYITASTLIDQLPVDTEERAKKVSDLKNEIQQATDDIRHLVTVPNPALLGDLATLTDGIFGQAFIKRENDLFVFSSDGRVYQLDRTQKVFKPASTQEPSVLATLSASSDDTRAYSLKQDQTISEFNQAESKQELMAFTKPEGTLIDLMGYAGRLYLLSVTPSDGQLYRAGRTGDGFGNPTQWITEKTTTLADARAFTIDGTVYILKKNGQITRFNSGSEEPWDMGIVDPPITNATTIWTDAESKYLYILEPDTKRVIVFQKETGAFIVQYRSESFSSLTDMIVDESA